MSNRLTRRGFFGMILGGIAAGTLLSSPAIADACEQFSDDPIAEAVRRARIPLDTTMAKMRRMAAFDYTINYLNRVFDPSLATAEEVYTILCFPSELAFYDDALTEAAMHRILLGNVPLAVVRLMLRPHEIPYNTRLFSGFGELTGRYKDAIMGNLRYSGQDWQTERDRSRRHQERMEAWRSQQNGLISGIPAHLVGI